MHLYTVIYPQRTLTRADFGKGTRQNRIAGCAFFVTCAKRYDPVSSGLKTNRIKALRIAFSVSHCFYTIYFGTFCRIMCHFAQFRTLCAPEYFSAGDPSVFTSRDPYESNQGDPNESIIRYGVVYNSKAPADAGTQANSKAGTLSIPRGLGG